MTTPVIDQYVRDLLVHEIDPEQLDRAMAAARIRLVAEMEDSQDVPVPRPIGASSWGRRLQRALLPTGRPRPISAVLVVTLAVLIAVGVSLAPNDDGTRSGLPQLAASASAAETLDWAGRAVLASGEDSVAGSGPVIHSVTVTKDHGRASKVEDRWYDTMSPAYRITTVLKGVDGEVFGEVVSFDGKVERIRHYRSVDGLTWVVNSTSEQLNVVGGRAPQAMLFGGRGATGPETDIDPLRAPRRSDAEPYRISATATVEQATRAWLAPAASSDDVPELEHAIDRFIGSTRGYFAYPGFDVTPAARRTTTVRQLSYLLGVTPRSSTAVAALYAEFGKLHGLHRLPDSRVEERPVIRLQFDQFDIEGSAASAGDDGSVRRVQEQKAASVLVIDLASGVPIEIESLDGLTRIRMSESRRVSVIGDSTEACRRFAGRLDCGVLDGVGPVAAEADRIADAPLSRDLARRASVPWMPYSVSADGTVTAADGAGKPRLQADFQGKLIPILPADPDPARD